MHKAVVAGFAALLITAISPGYAQAQTQAPAEATSTQDDLPSEADLKAITDLRIELVKGALQLKPEQTKLWPTVEEAIRGRATMRQARLAKLAAARNSDRDVEPIEIMRQRADTLNQRGAALKKLADAWQPLYQTLDEKQKLRLGLLVVYGLRVLQTSFDEEDEEE